MKTLLLISSTIISAMSFAQFDLEPLYVGPSHYYPQTGAQDLIVTFTQHEATTVTDFDCSFQVDGGATHTYTISTFDIYPVLSQGGVNRFTLTPSQIANNYAFNSMGNHTVKLWLTPTSGPDVNNANDTIVQTIKLIEGLPDKKILYQFYSHTTCGPCYGGGLRLDKIWNDYPNEIIPVFIHEANGGDPYEIPEGEILDGTYTYAHPTMINDQFMFPWFDDIEGAPSYDYWDTTRMTIDRLKFLYPLDLEIISKTWDAGTRTIDLEVEITVYDTLYQQHALNYWVVEDSVLGYQASAPDPNNYWHRNLLRAMPYGAWGDANILPATIYPGEVYYDQLSYVLPVAYDEAQTTIIATLQGDDAGDIFNRDIRVTEWIPFTNEDYVASVAEIESQFLRVFPNPTTGVLNVEGIEEGAEFTIEDSMGKIHQRGSYNGVINLDLAPGLYIFRTDSRSQNIILK